VNYAIKVFSPYLTCLFLQPKTWKILHATYFFNFFLITYHQKLYSECNKLLLFIDTITKLKRFRFVFDTKYFNKYRYYFIKD